MRKTLALATTAIILRAGMDCDWSHADGSDNLQEKDY